GDGCGRESTLPAPPGVHAGNPPTPKSEHKRRHIRESRRNRRRRLGAPRTWHGAWRPGRNPTAWQSPLNAVEFYQSGLMSSNSKHCSAPSDILALVADAHSIGTCLDAALVRRKSLLNAPTLGVIR